MSKEKPEDLGLKKVVGILTYEDPRLLEAKKRAMELIERAKFNEALVVIGELLTEVSTMNIAERHKIRRVFGKDGKLKESENGKEYKRAQLNRVLENLRQQILNDIEGLEKIVLDIEATKID